MFINSSKIVKIFRTFYHIMKIVIKIFGENFKITKSINTSGDFLESF